MDFKNELFQGQDAYFNENGCYPDIVFVRYDVWCEMFPRSPVPRGKGIDYHGKSYVQLRTCGGPMFQFSDREFMGSACASYCPYMNQLGLEVRDLIQQHTNGDTGSKHYDRGDYVPMMTDAMTVYNDWLLLVISKK